MIIDGQHRFLAAKELGITDLPVILVPPELARKMMNLNIEKNPNIGEKSYVRSPSTVTSSRTTRA